MLRMWKKSLNIWVLIALLLTTFLIILVTRISTTTNDVAAIALDRNECPWGRFYAYDLPSMFNTDLLLRHNCTTNSRNWLCYLALNHGMGRPAAELRAVLPENLLGSWFDTDQFTLEPIFHHRILRHRCRTSDLDSAAAFYIPFYVALALREYFGVKEPALRDSLCEVMLWWVQDQHPWQRSNGSDHFTTIARVAWNFRRPPGPDHLSEWSSTFLYMPAMERVTRFIIEKWPFDPHARDVPVPYPTGFHPQTAQALKNWQQFVLQYNRCSLFTFVGGPRPFYPADFRTVLLRYCSKESSCHVVDCSGAPCNDDYSAILEPFLLSEFCLQPPGDSPTRRSVFDCMTAGSVPVFFRNATYDQYGWFMPAQPESFSVYIDLDQVRNRTSVIKQVLMSYSKEEIRRKREKVIETIPRITYALGGSPDFKDAFDIALNGVLERMDKEREKEKGF